MVGNADIEVMVDQFGWLGIQSNIISREGHSVDTSGEIWVLPQIIHHAKLNFEAISPLNYRWALKRYVQEKIQYTSTSEGEQAFNHVKQHIFNAHHQLSETNDISQNSHELIKIFENRISDYRARRIFDRLYRSVKWYIWCAEEYPELGFDASYALELNSMSIPGGPRGEAVRMNDPNHGPLHKSLEVPLLLKALKEDTGKKFSHFQERAALTLSLAFGRNAANLVYLQESDFKNISPPGTPPCYIISMPRIKKGLLSPRDDLLDEYLDDNLVKYISELIIENKKKTCTLQINKKNVSIDKPLFIKQQSNSMAIESKQYQFAFNMYSSDILKLLKDFVKRHRIISPITKRLLYISVRRLRYTLATGLAAEGISMRELARILDHSDTQHVLVYFEMAGRIIEHLDKATAKKFSSYLGFFKGKVIENDNTAINGGREDKHLSFINEDSPLDQLEIGVCGESSICHLDPPFSCYLCPKFQPYRYADHEHVLECLLQSREEKLEKYEQNRLGIQLDEVIFSVAQVIKICKPETKNA